MSTDSSIFSSKFDADASVADPFFPAVDVWPQIMVNPMKAVIDSPSLHLGNDEEPAGPLVKPLDEWDKEATSENEPGSKTTVQILKETSALRSLSGRAVTNEKSVVHGGVGVTTFTSPAPTSIGKKIQSQHSKIEKEATIPTIAGNQSTSPTEKAHQAIHADSVT